MLKQDDASPRPVKYPRNTDLDPQLVWRGKDEQDWSDLVVHAPPLYIQEKIHPKVLIDDLLRQSKRYPFYLLADSREGQIKEAEVPAPCPVRSPYRGTSATASSMSAYRTLP